MNSQPPNLAPGNSSVPLWPRRAVKACASCRRDKIRCDGARPCIGCTKKGYLADQCIDGCEPCRRARARCENGKPCQRCRDLHIDCQEEFAVLPPRQEISNFPPRIARGPTDRAKLACSNCRRDNKKCDDQRPCSRCIARSEDCIHVTRGPKLVKLRCEGCRQDNKRCEESRPCKFCVESSKECIAMSRKGRGHGTRVKAACISCRRDKIRCDGARPCGSCIRKGCECIERACKLCAREGRTSDCTHRNTRDMIVCEPPDASIVSSSISDQPDERIQAGASTSLQICAHSLLPQLTQHHFHQQASQSQLNYPTPVMPIQPFYHSDQTVSVDQHTMALMQHPLHPNLIRPGYYPVIDPNTETL